MDTTGRAVTVATVSNPQMEDIQALTDRFTASTGILVQYVTLPENQMR
ncbi:MAG: hypothetical protein ACR2KP_01475 [Egibacteraceae bacterium]